MILHEAIFTNLFWQMIKEKAKIIPLPATDNQGVQIFPLHLLILLTGNFTIRPHICFTAT